MKYLHSITVMIPNKPLQIERTFTVDPDHFDRAIAMIEKMAEDVPDLKIKYSGYVLVLSPAEVLTQIIKEADPASLLTGLNRWR